MTPRLYEQIATVYTAMKAEAEGDVYRGYVTYLFEHLGFGISVYTPVMRRLQAMGCMEQIHQGGRGTPSQWQLLKDPTLEDFLASSGHRRSRIADLEARLAVLEEKAC